MIEYTTRPLVWTGPRTPREQRGSKRSFRAGYGDTLELLGHELALLNATAVVFEMDYRDGDIRVDGRPRANARPPQFPGVRISFNAPNLDRLQYETDRYVDWQHNVRAIALSLVALRAVDRYGTTAGQQQYTGFRELPAGNGANGFTSREAAAGFIRRHSPLVDAQTAPLNLTDHFRAAAKRLHPDQGGNAELFRQLLAAKALLDA